MATKMCFLENERDVFEEKVVNFNYVKGMAFSQKQKNVLSFHSSIKELYLCASCAEKKGIKENNSKGDFNLSGLLGNLLDDKNNEKNKVCPACGRKFLHIQKEKSVGCSECYNVFKNEIIEILKGFGVTKSYSGSLPNRLENFIYCFSLLGVFEIQKTFSNIFLFKICKFVCSYNHYMFYKLCIVQILLYHVINL